MKGLPTLHPDRLISKQSELLDLIPETARVTYDVIETHYHPVIKRFAAFAHLLPASQSHHHRGAGGLLRHSIEVGLWALRAADKVMMDSKKTPLERREMEPRWQLAVFLAALCHDAGKPFSDITVTNRDRTVIWKPLREDLYSWATRNEIDHYFLDWVEGRGKRHVSTSALVAARIIGDETFNYIEEGGKELIDWLQESLAGNPSPQNLIHDIVIKADQLSVERDLRTMGVAMAGYEIGVPVERHLTDIMRRFIKEGAWLVNEPGARVWNLNGNIYLVWPKAGEEIGRQVIEDKIPGIPRAPDLILDMLMEREIAFVKGEANDRYWRILPACVGEKIPDFTGLLAIRLRDDAMLSSTPIPSVDGRVLNETIIHTIGKLKVDEDGVVISDEEGGGEIKGAAENQKEKIENKKENAISTTLIPSVNQQQGGSTTASTQARNTVIQLDGAIGEAIKALMQDLKAGSKKWGVDAALNADGQVLLKWPDAFAGYGLAPKTILDELGEKDWLWVDALAPLKKILDADFGGQTYKAIQLERDLSKVFLLGGQPPQHSSHAAGKTKTATSKQSVPAPAVSAPAEPVNDAKAPTKAAATLAESQPKPDPEDQTQQKTKSTDSSPMLEAVIAILKPLQGTITPDGWCIIKEHHARKALTDAGFSMEAIKKLEGQYPENLEINNNKISFKET
jgi:conjugal transfer pilus assembly protein TraI